MYDQTKPYKKKILELISQTWETPYVSVKGSIYPIIEKKFSYSELDHTDGIGTKEIYHLYFYATAMALLFIISSLTGIRIIVFGLVLVLGTILGTLYFIYVLISTLRKRGRY